MVMTAPAALRGDIILREMTLSDQIGSRKFALRPGSTRTNISDDQFASRVQTNRDDGRGDRGGEAEWHRHRQTARSCHRHRLRSQQIAAQQVAVVAQTSGPCHSLCRLVQHGLPRHRCYSVYWSPHRVMRQEHV